MEWDAHLELMASHKAAALIRDARQITWDADVYALRSLGIRPSLRLADKRAELLKALYAATIGVRRGAKDALTHVAITSREGTKVATLDMPLGYALP